MGHCPRLSQACCQWGFTRECGKSLVVVPPTAIKCSGGYELPPLEGAERHGSSMERVLVPRPALHPTGQVTLGGSAASLGFTFFISVLIDT